MTEKFNLKNEKVSPEEKLTKLKMDQENIKTDLLKYFDIKIEEINEKKEFFDKKDEMDSEDLISRYKILNEKIEKWKKIVEDSKI